MIRLRSGHSLVGMLVAMAVLIGLVLFFVFRGYGLAGSNTERKDKIGQTIVGRSLARAKDEKCMEQLRQVRQSIEILNPTGDEPLQSLAETKLGPTLLACPLGQEDYRYDQAESTVHCPHLGHEKY